MQPRTPRQSTATPARLAPSKAAEFVADREEALLNAIEERNHSKYGSRKYKAAVARAEKIEQAASMAVFGDTAHSFTECQDMVEGRTPPAVPAKDKQIIEDAVNAVFSSIQDELDPKNELDLGGWAGIVYDGDCREDSDVEQLKAIIGRILTAHRGAVAESDIENA